MLLCFHLSVGMRPNPSARCECLALCTQFIFFCENVNFSPKSFLPFLHSFDSEEPRLACKQFIFDVSHGPTACVRYDASLSLSLPLLHSLCVCRVQSGVRKTSASPIGIEIINDFQAYKLYTFSFNKSCATLFAPPLPRAKAAAAAAKKSPFLIYNVD